VQVGERVGEDLVQQRVAGAHPAPLAGRTPARAPDIRRSRAVRAMSDRLDGVRAAVGQRLGREEAGVVEVESLVGARPDVAGPVAEQEQVAVLDDRLDVACRQRPWLAPRSASSPPGTGFRTRSSSALVHAPAVIRVT
jgi:hypothetical protein